MASVLQAGLVPLMALALGLLPSLSQAQQAQPSPPVAEAQAEPLLEVVSADAQKLQYAQRLMALSTPDLDKTLRESLLEQMANLPADVPATEAAWLRKTLSELVVVHTRSLIGRLEQLYADRFSLEELSALIAFRDTPMGQAISRKELALADEVAMAQMQMQQAMMMELMTAYCRQFSCEAKGGLNPSVTPKPRPH